MSSKSLIELLPFCKNLNLLYVEDNIDDRKVTHKLLKKFFNNIIVAVDGEDGLKKILQNSIDLIITDIDMPNMNGINMISKIREQKQNIPILILSAYNEPKYFIDSINIGIEGFILKPIQLEQFTKILTKTINIIKLKFENEDYRKNLELKIEEKTAQLQESKERAERASYVKSEYLTNMSHEIRTPINHILGFTDLLSEKVEDEIEKEYLNAIKMGANTLLGIINNILDISKIESGDLLLYPQLNKIKEIFLSIKEPFELNLKQKNIDFLIDIDEELPDYIYIDEIRLKQILINLVANSIKYTNKGFVKLKIKKLKIHDNKVDLFIFVIDTGSGFNKKSRETISKALKQKNGQCLRKYEGTGLGLSICKDLVSLMNGKISLKSKELVGSTFSILLKDIPYNSNTIVSY